MKKNKSLSKQPSKQRKQMYIAPLHKRRKKLTASLAPALAEVEGVKKLVVRKGDTVRILRGSFRGIEGEVSAVGYKSMKLTIEGVTFEKSDHERQTQKSNCRSKNSSSNRGGTGQKVGM